MHSYKEHKLPSVKSPRASKTQTSCVNNTSTSKSSPYRPALYTLYHLAEYTVHSIAYININIVQQNTLRDLQNTCKIYSRRIY